MIKTAAQSYLALLSSIVGKNNKINLEFFSPFTGHRNVASLKTTKFSAEI